MSIAAVGQFCATSAISSNRAICRDLITQAARLGAKVSLIYFITVTLMLFIDTIAIFIKKR